MNNQFNHTKINKLNNPARLEMVPPQYIWDRLHLSQHEIKVEIGAGTGLFSTAFQKLSGIGRTIALDISHDMVDYMCKNVAGAHPEIIPTLVTGSHLPIEKDFTDLVYMIAVHHELDDPRTMMSEAHRILHRGGRIFICDWNLRNLTMGPASELRYTPEKVASQLEEAGFINIEIDPGFDSFFLVLAEA